MELKDSDVEKIRRILRDIKTESRKDKQRRHRIENLSEQISTVMRKAERRCRTTARN